MTDILNSIDRAVEGQFRDQPAHSRRKFVGLAGATLGSLGLIAATPKKAWAKHDSTQTILNVAATAEVLATIVNTNPVSTGVAKREAPGLSRGLLC